MTKEGVRLKLTVALAAGLLLAAVVGLAESGFPRKPIICPQTITPLVSNFGAASPLAFARPCPGNALGFSVSNIATLDQGAAGKNSDAPIFVWQSTGPDNFEIKWRSEVSDEYYDVQIGDPDSDDEREIVAFTYDSVTVSGGKGKKAPRVTELRVFFHVYEAGSTGLPDAVSPYAVVDRNAWSTDSLIGNVDGDEQNEIVALVSNTMVIFDFVQGQGYRVEFVSDPQAVVLNDGDLGDVDGDGKAEIVTGTSDGTVFVWDDQVGGEWTPTISEPSPSPPLYKTRTGDIIGDSKPEIVSVSYDSNLGETYISVWEHSDGAYLLLSTPQILDLERQLYGRAFALEDLTGDGKAEMILGAQGDNGLERVMVLSFDGSVWIELWSTLTQAVTNDVWVGDADGPPATVNLVLTGAKDGLYVEVFTWSSADGSAISSWSFTGKFNPAWDSHFG